MFLKKPKGLCITYVLYTYMVLNKDGKKKPVTLSFREGVWKKYQKYCKNNDLTPSREIQDYMRDETL